MQPLEVYGVSCSCSTAVLFTLGQHFACVPCIQVKLRLAARNTLV